MTTFKVEQFVKAPPTHVYFAFTRATGLREWLCDVATVSPHPGGRMYLWWNGDYYSSGEFTTLEENKSVGFKWRGRWDPGFSEVNVTLEKKEGGTQVTLAQTLPEGEAWQDLGDGFQKEWKVSLENLASVLETGLDQRFYSRPMLGILPGDFTPEQAERLGVPVKEGLRLDGTVEGMGAKAAGLDKNDVIISMAGKAITRDFSTLVTVLSELKGGDKTKVVFYRGPEKKTVTMELSRRPVPDIPFDTEELANMVKARNDESLKALQECFESVSDQAASARIAPSEWNAKEVLAHIIQSERFNPYYIAELVNGHERWADDFGSNIHAQVKATVDAFPTVDDLLGELERAMTETVAFLRRLPPEFVARKGSYFRLAAGMLQGEIHPMEHIDQIKAAIAQGK